MSELNDPRVVFVAERSLLAWNETCILLIAFGFVVERSELFLESLYGIRSPHSSIASCRHSPLHTFVAHRP